ncbi:unnamed protein product [Cylicocyclus nassatus]|uniref:DDE Tnp4 domain-containing protein n=1 Tax=Cylicocyclus nassatus TaxID=53992 RepID=A0AA36M8P3_CYLNA|nr:unnamed protein product [Cylicocyclus nassatus]
MHAYAAKTLNSSSQEDKTVNPVLITLRYLATNSHQTVIADCFGMGQKARPASSDSGHRMNAGACEGLENSPGTRASQMSLDAPIVASSESSGPSTSATTILPKGTLCYQHDCIVDAMARFMYINCGFAGRHHDSFIWQHSQAAAEFDEGRARRRYCLLSDAGFANPRSVMAPFRELATENDIRKRRFNREHAKLDESSSRRSERKAAFLHTVQHHPHSGSEAPEGIEGLHHSLQHRRLSGNA